MLRKGKLGLAVVALVLLAFGFSACGLSPSGSVGSGEDISGSGACGAPGGQPGAVVVLVPGTTSADSSATIDAGRLEAASVVASGAGSLKARLLVLPLRTSAAATKVSLDVSADPTAPNLLFARTELSCVKTKVLDSVSHAASDLVHGSPDIIGALEAISSEASRSAHVDVVFMSSMLQSGSGLNLLGLRPQSVPALVSKAERSGLLPSCKGWDFYVVGGGETSSGPVSDVTGAALRSFWSGVFTACGGRLVEWTSSLEQFPIEGSQPPLLDIVVKGKQVSITLPADLLFPSGSARLLSSSRPALLELAGLLEHRYPTGRIELTGYCDSEPTTYPGGNQPLSLARATAVAAALDALGVSPGRIKTHGEGASHFVASNDSAAGRQANRRVVVTVGS